MPNCLCISQEQPFSFLGVQNTCWLVLLDILQCGKVRFYIGNEKCCTWIEIGIKALQTLMYFFFSSKWSYTALRCMHWGAQLQHLARGECWANSNLAVLQHSPSLIVKRKNNQLEKKKKLQPQAKYENVINRIILKLVMLELQNFYA